MSSLLLYLSVVVVCFAEIFVWSKLYDERINFKSVLLYVSIIVLSLLGMLNHLYVNAFVSVSIVTALMAFCNWLIFKRRLNEVIVSTIYGQFILAFADGISVVILILLMGKDTVFIRNNMFDTFLSNIFVSVVYYLFCMLPFVRQLYCNIISFTQKIKFRNLFVGCILFIISINFLMAIIYYDLKSIYVIIINSVLLLIYSFIVYKSLNEKNNSMIVKAQNDSLINSLQQYEDMVDRQRVDNHENKNQLLIIKNMIKKNDKDVLKYIDTIVKDQKEDDEALYTRVMTIPSGGLQGIIYQKMLVMKDERILFSLDVSRDVRKIELDSLSMEDNYNLCKIIGVLLDNAIEESRNIDDKCIMISLYVDEGDMVIDISNRFNGNVDVDKLDLEGYTTKGEGHGYGLSLVKKIVSESGTFENERKIRKDIFKQIVRVKIKNT